MATYERVVMGFVATLNDPPRTAAFNRKKGSYMIVRGDMPTGMVPVAEVIDGEGRGFAVREIDQGEISLSFDYTVVWITARTSNAVQAHALALLARKTLLKAEISFTSATGLAHEHLFVPWEKAPEAMALLHYVSLELRMHE